MIKTVRLVGNDYISSSNMTVSGISLDAHYKRVKEKNEVLAATDGYDLAVLAVHDTSEHLAAEGKKDASHILTCSASRWKNGSSEGEILS